MSKLIKQSKLKTFFNNILCEKLDEVNPLSMQILMEDCEEVLNELAVELDVEENQRFEEERALRWQDFNDSLAELDAI